MLDRLEQVFRRRRDFGSDARTSCRAADGPPQDSSSCSSRSMTPRMRQARGRDSAPGARPRGTNTSTTCSALAAAESSGHRPGLGRIDAPGLHGGLAARPALLGRLHDLRVHGPSSGILKTDPERLTQVLADLARRRHLGRPAPATPFRSRRDPARRAGSVEHHRKRSPASPPAKLDRVFGRLHRRRRRPGPAAQRSLPRARGSARALVDARNGRIATSRRPGPGAATLRFQSCPGSAPRDL